ncbi:site-2 protease family protein [Patulibacter sp. NPDC049589]|uniref:site-2 protease family protein n=1 Tax=Patulibacter sp. NPDC049589 TaxID=3154731 RepID=UPI00341B239C
MGGPGPRLLGARLVVSANVGVLPVLAGIVAFRQVRDASWLVDDGPAPDPGDLAAAQRVLERWDARMRDIDSAFEHPSVVWALVAAGAVALLYVLSILAHELGHAWAVRRAGLQADTIELGATGGFVTFPDDEHLTAGRLAAIAAAGPAVTALIAGVSFGALAVLGWPIAASPDAGSTAGVVAQQVLGTTFILNAVVLVINLLPFRPLDGGQLLAAAALRLRRGGR